MTTAAPLVMVNQRLPDEVRECLRALKADSDLALESSKRPGRGHGRSDYEYHLLLSYLHDLSRRGWTRVALGDGLGVSRERVRQLSSREYTRLDITRLPTASPPERLAPEPAPKPLRLSDYEVHRLQELAAVKAKRRSNAGPDHPTTKATVAYLDLVEAAWDRGVSTYMMAKQTGFSHGSFAQSLMRRDRIATPPSLQGNFRPLDKVGATSIVRGLRPGRWTHDVMLTTDSVDRLRALHTRRKNARGRVTKSQYTVMIDALIAHLYHHDKVPTRVIAQQTGLPHSSIERSARKGATA